MKSLSKADFFGFNNFCHTVSSCFYMGEKNKKGNRNFFTHNSDKKRIARYKLLKN